MRVRVRKCMCVSSLLYHPSSHSSITHLFASTFTPGGPETGTHIEYERKLLSHQLVHFGFATAAIRTKLRFKRIRQKNPFFLAQNDFNQLATLATSYPFADPNTKALFRGVSVYRDGEKEIFKAELQIIGKIETLESQTKSDYASFVAKHNLPIAEHAKKSKTQEGGVLSNFANFPKDSGQLQAVLQALV